MKRSDFSEPQQLHLIKTLKGYHAFVPPPLPPELDIGRLAYKLAAASQAIGELNGAARRIPNTRMLISPLVQREALVSSAIEGTITTIDNMLLQAVAPDGKKDDNAREAFNYVSALNRAELMLKTLPISHRIIKTAHAILLSGLSPARGAGKRPGEYKTDQNAIGKNGDNEETARYVPPPPQETQKCMDQLEAYINRNETGEGQALIELALVHYQFEAIHPFADGNGRIGRLLVTLMAIQSGLVQHPLLHISSSIEKDNRKDQYIGALYNVSTQGKWEDWIAFFLDIIKESCRDAILLADDLIKLQDEMKSKALNAGNSPRALVIIDRLFLAPYINAPDVAELCQTSFPTAQADLAKLVAIGLLSPLPIQMKPQTYVAHPIWQLGGRRKQQPATE